MTIPLNIFLYIVIPELFLFSVWVLMCVSSMKLMGEVQKKKKPKEVVLRKSSYPFEEGEPVVYDPYLG